MTRHRLILWIRYVELALALAVLACIVPYEFKLPFILGSPICLMYPALASTSSGCSECSSGTFPASVQIDISGLQNNAPWIFCPESDGTYLPSTATAVGCWFSTNNQPIGATDGFGGSQYIRAEIFENPSTRTVRLYETTALMCLNTDTGLSSPRICTSIATSPPCSGIAACNWNAVTATITPLTWI
jgi:hypothetical protein